VQYDSGAFDAETGFSHGWKSSPILRHIGVSFLAPGRLLRSVEK
jgi:hypothetical protein